VRTRSAPSRAGRAVHETQRVWRPDRRSPVEAPALVDTHIWIWYLDGTQGVMSADVVGWLRRAASTHGLLVSDMSVWEVGTKAAKGKLSLAPSVAAWIDRASEQPGFAFAAVDRTTLLASTQLPGAIHGDPVDRILIATAANAGVPLVTADRAIIEYVEDNGVISVYDARP
jgi:PIN domain nuclease of toxin-antitoxin system